VSRENQPIGVGLAGLGLGAALTVPHIAADPRFRIVAAADPRREAREAFVASTGGRPYADVAALARDPGVELVYVSTPHYLHHEHAVLAIQAGRHVLVEKPLARTAQQADAIVRAARDRGVRALYGHTHAHDPVIQEMARLVRSGEVGRLGTIVSLNFNDFVYKPRADWELDGQVSGGSPFIQGAHQLDIVRWIAGAPVTRVMGWSSVLDPQRPLAGTHTAMLEFQNGAAATAVFSGYAHFDTARWMAWRAESGDPRPPSAHRATAEAYDRRRSSEADEAAARNARRIGVQPLLPGPGAAQHELFGVTIVSAELADLRQVPSGVLLEAGARTRRVRIRPRSGRTVMLNDAYRAIRGEMEVELDAAWAVETVRIAEIVERNGTALRPAEGSELDELPRSLALTTAQMQPAASPPRKA
jgi:phthalate 4,5-cis-dihydrodiol dehydrogenase